MECASVPTPCGSKRHMNDELIQRFHKRLRLTGAPPPSQYAEANGFLQLLHSERRERRRAQAAQAPDGVCDPAGTMCDVDSLERPSSAQGSAPMFTSFCLGDVVVCGHGLGGRCLQCSGRVVQNVPLPLYVEFCRAYGPSAGSSSDGLQRPGSASAALARLGAATSGSAGAAELSFAALVSLAATLAPEPTERLLHLGSGIGAAAIAWALLFPQSAVSGVERRPAAHAVAVAAAERLEPEVRRRLFLHCGDSLASQGDWRQATVILVSPSACEDSELERLTQGLQNVEAGTRVVAISRALDSRGSAMLGLELVRQAAYRTAIGSGNCTVFIYRKLAEC
eukprot:TRINITY_DN25565_c0_g1_i1.p1 TRINITY_DN25565_c0_g1~~TRINITY_DN25565_c0_g1_i1.p1  ORF type:complete len:338 (-),score=64.61 TRINITY_DN25565_c0_g1_i1:143-1156(-)